VPIYDEGRGEIGFYRVILPRADGHGDVASVPEQPFGLRFIAELLSDEETRLWLRSEGWRVAGVDHGKSYLPAEPRVGRWTELKFERGNGNGSERGTLTLFHDREALSGAPLCVERLTALPTIDLAIAMLELTKCNPVPQPQNAFPSGADSNAISSKYRSGSSVGR